MSHNFVKSVLVLFLNLSLLVAGTGCATSRSSWTGNSSQTRVFTFRHAYANAHLIKLDEKSFIMVDSGGYEKAADLESDLIENKIDPTYIKAIILTHGHWDHAAGAKYFQDKYQIPVVAGVCDQHLLEQGKSETLCPTSFFAKLRLKDDEAMVFKSPNITKWISEKTNLKDLLGFDVDVIPLPSHTNGSLAVISGNIAFVGDLFRGSIVGSAPETHFYICDLMSNRQYIEEFLKTDGKNVEHFFTGHFGPVFERNAVVDFFDLKL
jgi:glyoxylase-like metal-dependent hydrolase (beta-lactamase superfamily II)